MNATMNYLGNTLTLTTEHAASSYGRPVLVMDGQAYGPADQMEFGAMSDVASAIVRIAQIDGEDIMGNVMAGDNDANVAAARDLIAKF